MKSLRGGIKSEEKHNISTWAIYWSNSVTSCYWRELLLQLWSAQKKEKIYGWKS